MISLPALLGPPRQYLVCRQLRRPRGNLTSYTLSSTATRSPQRDSAGSPSTCLVLHGLLRRPVYGKGLSQVPLPNACAPGLSTATGNTQRGSKGFRGLCPRLPSVPPFYTVARSAQRGSRVLPTPAQCRRTFQSGQGQAEGLNGLTLNLASAGGFSKSSQEHTCQVLQSFLQRLGANRVVQRAPTTPAQGRSIFHSVQGHVGKFKSPPQHLPSAPAFSTAFMGTHGFKSRHQPDQ